MSRINYILICALLLLFASCSKKSHVTTNNLTLQPTNNSNEMIIAILNGGDISKPNIELPVETWTEQGDPLIIRGLFKFDLSTIPASATIKSASLSLYSDTLPTNGDLIHANLGTNNSMWLQQVTSDWSTSTANWSNQPSVSTANQISISSTTNAFLNLDIDVTSMVSTMVKSSANYGFALKLQNETAYTSRIFCSSSSAYTERHPKLMITYTTTN